MGWRGVLRLVGDGHHDTLATFIIALDPVLKPLIFRSIDHVDKESRFPGVPDGRGSDLGSTEFSRYGPEPKSTAWGERGLLFPCI